jgi:4'-phosphopantetheinyl transferase
MFRLLPGGRLQFRPCVVAFARSFRGPPVSFAGNTITWPEPAPDWPSASGPIQVWAFRLEVPQRLLERYATLLCPAETERAARFRSSLHRNRFVAGRGALRAILGRYLNAAPEAIEFEYGAQGKPALSGLESRPGLQFNLAHTGDLALLAVARSTPVGVDVEQVRALAEFDSLVDRFFSARENAAFRALTSEEKPAAFFNLWTRKEAWLKATGEGIGAFLNRVEVSFLPGEPARFLGLPPGTDPRSEWRLTTLDPAPGYAGALAFEGDVEPVQCWQWPTVPWSAAE